MICKVLDKLYVGDAEYTRDEADRYGIGFIINVGGKQSLYQDYHIHLRDGEGNDMNDVMSIVRMIQQKITFGRKVLVHCRKGESRSPYIAYRYLKTVGFGESEALDYVVECVPGARINEGLFKTDWGYSK